MKYTNKDYLYYAYLSLYPAGNDEKFIKEQLEHYDQILEKEKIKKILEMVKIQKDFFERCKEFELTEKEITRFSDIVRTVSLQKLQDSNFEKNSNGKSL